MPLLQGRHFGHASSTALHPPGSKQKVVVKVGCRMQRANLQLHQSQCQTSSRRLTPGLLIRQHLRYRLLVLESPKLDTSSAIP